MSDAEMQVCIIQNNFTWRLKLLSSALLHTNVSSWKRRGMYNVNTARRTPVTTVWKFWDYAESTYIDDLSAFVFIVDLSNA